MLSYKEFMSSMKNASPDVENALDERLLQEKTSAEIHRKSAVWQAKKLIRDALKTNDENQKLDALLKSLQKIVIIFENL